MTKSEKQNSLRVGIAGLGTVGAATVSLLEKQQALLTKRCGVAIVPTAVSAQTRGKDRGLDLSTYRWFDNPVALAKDPDIDVVVEVIGGSEGTALDVVKTALSLGKPVVTANKALIAHHGDALARLAEENDTFIAYESAVAGGIPAIKTVREGLAANTIECVFGILNGTCNYILTTMGETGREFGDVLEEAQQLGYAEADPSFDVDGVDAAHKLAILASISFGAKINFDAIDIEGIRRVSAQDIEFAASLGYKIKLLGVARRTVDGIEQYVHPCLVSQTSAIASVEGVFNAVVAQGDYVGQVMAVGRGAGGNPTASAVVADLVDVARGNVLPTFGVNSYALEVLHSADRGTQSCKLFIRLLVADRPGVVAEIAQIFADSGLSLESLVQRGTQGPVTSLVVITHSSPELALTNALGKIDALESVLEAPHTLRIENF